MGDRHGGAEQVAAGPDRLAHGDTPVEHDLEVEVGDGRARGADWSLEGSPASGPR